MMLVPVRMKNLEGRRPVFNDVARAEFGGRAGICVA